MSNLRSQLKTPSKIDSSFDNKTSFTKKSDQTPSVRGSYVSSGKHKSLHPSRSTIQLKNNSSELQNPSQKRHHESVVGAKVDGEKRKGLSSSIAGLAGSLKKKVMGLSGSTIQ